MKILIVDTYYKNFLSSFYKNHQVDKLSYVEHGKLLLSQFFGTGDSYSYYLDKHGHQAEEIIANDELLQRKWASENKVDIEESGFLSKIQMLPIFHKFIGRPDWVQKIVLKQISIKKPDIVYMQDLSILNPNTLKQIKKTCFLMGQIACPLPNLRYLKEFDLIVTSLPHYVEKLRKNGVRSEYFKIGFDPRILDKIGKQKRIYDVTFVGGISPSHKKGLRLLKALANKIKIDMWGYGKEYLVPGTKLHKYHHGEVWALDMYKILAQSKITINRHIDVAEKYANNMRLYEATGMGALLITDKKNNLKELFDINKEVVDYKDATDLARKVTYYLGHPKVRKMIARVGQSKTIKNHTYGIRMSELLKIINKYYKV